MNDLMFGVETEYAISAISPGGPIEREELLQRLMGFARRDLVHLRDLCSPQGIFLQNASRFYLDCGHPEIGSPEVQNPWDAVRYLEAGHSVLAGLASSVESSFPSGTEVVCFRCNVDYSTGTTWGAHESYLHQASQAALQTQLITFLSTRQIFTGAGGFNPLSRGLEFSLSPRLVHFRRLASGNSTQDRPIFHEKNEPLSSGGNSRLHIICGENLCSQTAALLKIGTTALVVAMANAGLTPGNAVQLADPLEALHCVAADVTCRKPLRMADGNCLTAIAIQRHYLEQVEAHVEDSFMPVWATEVCRHWRAVLDLLEGAPDSVAQTLDWGIKLSLYSNHARSRGICWDDLPFWNQIIGRLAAALERCRSRLRVMPLEDAIGPKSPIRKELAALDPFLQSRGFEWGDLRKLLRYRQEFFEIDTRFGQLGPRGIFQMLDSAGVLNHRVSGVDNIEQAVAEPPTSGRARLRGQVIQRLAGSDAQCDWQQIIKTRGKQCQSLDLSNPFATEESWKVLSRAEVRGTLFTQTSAAFLSLDDAGDDGEQRPFVRRQDAADRILRGDYSGAETLLRGLAQERFMMPSTHCHLARVLLMTDREAEARDQISQAWVIREQADNYVVLRILFFQCLFAIFDGADLTAILEQIKAALHTPGSHLDWTIQPMLDYLHARLGHTNYALLKALGEALSSSSAMPHLDRFPQWRVASSVSGSQRAS